MRISTGTVTVALGETTVTEWVGDDEVALTETSAPAGSQVVIEGYANFIKLRHSTESFELVLPHAGAGGDELATAISAMTPEETRTGVLNERTATLLQQLSVVEANGRGLFYRFDAGTADTQPTAGHLRVNHLDVSSSTGGYFDNLDANGAAVAAELDTWDDSSSLTKGRLWLRSIADPSAFHALKITGSVVDGTGYRKLTWSYVGGGGSFAADEALMAFFVPTGDRGDGFVTDADVADPSGLAAYEAEEAGFRVFVTDLGTDFGAYTGRSGVVRLIAGPDWEVTAIYTGTKGDASMVPGPTGPAGIVWKGAYDVGTAYQINDGVRFNGSSFRKLTASGAGNAPSSAAPPVDNTHWAVVAVKGQDGAGTGDMVGPASTIDGEPVFFDGESGKLTRSGTGLSAAQKSKARGVIGADLLAGFRNKLINGGFDIWQRGESQTSSGYGSVDRWFQHNVGSTKTTSLQTFPLGQTDVPDNPKYFMRTVVASVAGANNLVRSYQGIEGVETFAGQKSTLTFYAKADAAKDIAISFDQVFGSGGSPSGAVVGLAAQKVALTAAWQKYSIVVDLPSIAGKTLGSAGADALYVNFWFDAGSNHNARTDSLGQQSGTFDIARVSLVQGDATAEADPFSPRHIQQEWALCERYYEVVRAGIWAAVSGNVTNAVLTTVAYHVEKRVSPAITRLNNLVTSSEAGTVAYTLGGTTSLLLAKPPGALSPGICGGIFGAEAEL